MAGLIIALVIALAIAGWEGYLLWRNISLIINVTVTEENDLKIGSFDLTSERKDNGVIIVHGGAKYDKSGKGK